MKFAFFGYRAWANWIFLNLLEIRQFQYVTDIEEADVVLFYGWSQMIPKEIYKNKLCLILHPSPLPKYRGGSPLQHQIMNGETKSAVTICRVTDKLDSGDIYSQTPLSLEGSLDDILDRIVEIGTRDTIQVLIDIKYNLAKPRKQKGRASVYKRRKPEESEITFKDLKTKTAKELHDFIRALADPYPNAFIKCKDGKKFYIKSSSL